MGSLRFHLKYASGIEDADTISNNDLYGIITYGGQKATTKVAKDGIFHGFKFSWDATFSFEAANDDTLEIRLYDKDVGFDDYIGKAIFNVAQARGGSVELKAGVVNKKHEEKGFVVAVVEYA